MTVRGDLVATLVSKGKTLDEARDLVAAILDCADDPNFAMAFAADMEAQTQDERTTQMGNYWNVIGFLKETIS